MECRNVRALAADQPAQEQLAQLQSHVMSCEACRDELGELPAILRAPVLLRAPASLAAQVLERLPAAPPAEAARAERQQRRRRRVFSGLGALAAAVLLQIGLLGVFVDSSIPANLVGGAESGLGRLVLGLTVAAKPIASLVSVLSFSLFLASMVGIVLVAWLWLRLMQPPAPLLVELEVRP